MKTASILVLNVYPKSLRFRIRKIDVVGHGFPCNLKALLVSGYETKVHSKMVSTGRVVTDCRRPVHVRFKLERGA